MEYYQQPSEKIFETLNSSADGLSENEAKQRQERDGLNELETETKINKLKLFIRQFKSFIIYIMLFALVLSLILGEYSDAIVIAAILIANAIIGYYQELSAQKSMQALKEMGVVKAKVVRDGNTKEIDSKYLVKGDVIYLDAGDKVPADARIFKSTELNIEESALTGESLAVEKNADPLEKEAQIGDQSNMVFSSTNIQRGTAWAVVVKTGMETEIGKITEMVKTAEKQLTPLQKRLDHFGKRLGYAVIGICLIVLLVIGVRDYLENGFSWEVVLDALLVAAALAVAAVPSGLPAVVTIALSAGVKKLLKRKALVRELASVETLGSCNVICSDKTGTITQNQMTVKKAWTLESEAEIEGSGYEPEGEIKDYVSSLLFEIGKVCNNSSVGKEEGEWKISGDPTEAALLVSAQKAGVNGEAERLDEIPFNSDRKRMSVLVKSEGKELIYTKGAPDQILEVCSHVMQGEDTVEMSDELRNKIQDQVDNFSQQALRVLAFAYKEKNGEFKEDGLTFVGLQAMIDPPRPDVVDSISITKKAGIRVIMITGDYKETASAIGGDVGIEGEALTGTELGNMSDEELEEHLEKGANVFARVVPEHKQRIIAALQRKGNVVAMTGDGVNDAPALKKANIGVAVGSGTDVAKEASDFVLMDDSFTNIVHAVEEGRGIYDNIQKAIMHLLSGNLSEVLIIFVATLLGWNLPLTAIMLLWINLISDGAPALALAVDPYGEDIMERKPKKGGSSILPKPELILTCVLAVISTIGALVLFYWTGGNEEEQFQLAQTTTFTFVVISEFVLLFAVRSYFSIPVFTNKWLWIGVATSLILQAILIYVPAMREIFELEMLGAREWMAIGIALASVAVLSFIAKAITKKQVKG
ncbi:cation-translocating P-type ATPase [Catalinimonas niigatensis]|uniref:cation-translocating P-type ATPase n=1 Tax=Catalinimonas niigatensis TaxID=1397264 RepID=UPI002666BACF|nr:HAD-IC family P-type ATPase [Catalinimonas niigatensis]WPP51358.1 HAD-IC family P-type ATPase [Catalinimonas niigatensis]